MAAKGSGRSLTGGVTLLVALAVFLSTLLSVVGIGWLASRNDRSSFSERILGETRRVIQAAVDPRFQGKAEEINRVLARLLVIEALRGASVFDETGHRLETFGEIPETEFALLGDGRFPIHAVANPARIEFHYPPSDSGTPFHILVRVDNTSASRLEQLGWDRLLFLAITGAAIAGLAAGALMLLQIARPLQKIGKVMELVVADPAKADTGATLRPGGNEIGRLSASVEQLRSMIAEAWRTRVAVADAILEHAPIGIIQYAGDGTPAGSNPAAASLLGRDIGRGASASQILVRNPESDIQQPLREQLISQAGAPRLLEIPTARGPRFTIASSLTIGKDGRNSQIIALMADASDLQRARLEAETIGKDLAGRLDLARRREFELKLTLESCLALLSGPDKAKDDRLDAVPFAREWLDAARDAGILSNINLVNAEGPEVEGPTEDLRAAMRLALLACVARCGQTPADIVVDVKGINFETAGVTIRAQKTVSDEAVLQPAVADWQIAFAALRIALRKANGQLAEFNATEEGVMIRLVLRGAAERMSTMKAR